MNHFARQLTRIIFISLSLMIAGCTSIDEIKVNPDANKLGVLIICGEGLNPIYSDLKDIKAASVWFTTSQKIAESLHTEIQKKRTDAQIYINTNRNIDTNTYLTQLLTDKKRDGLIQVAISHIKNETENSVYLDLTYNTIKFQKTESGESITIGEGISEKHRIIGDAMLNKLNMNIPLSQYAIDFSNALYKAGYIGSN